MADTLPLNIACPQLIHRERELAAAEQLLAASASGQARVLLLAGEAGIGKSRLSAEIAMRATERGFHVLRAACLADDQALPFAPLGDLLRVVGTQHDRHALRAALGPALPALTGLLPELGADASAASDHVSLEKPLLFRALTRVLSPSFVAPAAPALLVIEDVHWCDAATLEFLPSFIQRSANEPLLLLLSYRDDEVGGDLARLLAALSRLRPAVAELRLGQLDPPGVRQMIAAIFGQARPVRPEFVAAIHSYSLRPASTASPSATPWPARPSSPHSWPASAARSTRRLPNCWSANAMSGPPSWPTITMRPGSGPRRPSTAVSRASRLSPCSRRRPQPSTSAGPLAPLSSWARSSRPTSGWRAVRRWSTSAICRRRRPTSARRRAGPGQRRQTRRDSGTAWTGLSLRRPGLRAGRGLPRAGPRPCPCDRRRAPPHPDPEPARQLAPDDRSSRAYHPLPRRGPRPSTGHGRSARTGHHQRPTRDRPPDARRRPGRRALLRAGPCPLAGRLRAPVAGLDPGGLRDPRRQCAVRYGGLRAHAPRPVSGRGCGGPRPGASDRLAQR